MWTEKRFKKTPHYKSSFVVNDPNPKLVICLTNTAFQACTDLDSDDCCDDEFKIDDSGDYIVVTRIAEE